jgi:nicotinate-nucleotide pyrophosphorylase (carboxylating)
MKIPSDVKKDVQTALAEDIGSGDITAALIPSDQQAQGKIICKDTGVLCGIPWADETFRQLDSNISISWHVADGDPIEMSQLLCRIKGPARAIMSGERTALNFLQTLSATATQTATLVAEISHTAATLLDTRKTLPGMRAAQKYAVRCAGAKNHRMGLFDNYLIKENHIASCRGIAEAISSARLLKPGKPVEIEVRDLKQLETALQAEADIIMLDNFPLSDLATAVIRNAGRAKLEASGGIEAGQLVKIAETGVDYISVGAITKHCRAIDLSLLIDS